MRADRSVFSRACALLVFVVAGCSAAPPPAPSVAPNEVGTPTVDPAPVGQATAAPRATIAATAPPAKPFTREQRLRMPITEPPTLDPGLATDSVSIDVISQIFEGLLGFDDRGTIVPLGAERWTMSEDGLTYTFTLRDGSRWSDGKPVTAGDYEWAWKRTVDPQTASDYATVFYPIKNALKIHRQRLDPAELGVVATDERTLVVTLEQPAAFFLRLVSGWTMLPVRRDVVERFGDKWTEAKNVVTNGPFVLKAWRHDERITLERYDDYWGAKPALATVAYRIYPADAAPDVLAAYQAGELDAVGSGAAFDLSAIQGDRFVADPTLQRELKTFPQSATMFLTVNHRRPHLQDPRVRMALGQVIERRRLLEDVLQRVGAPAAGLLPEGLVARRPDLWPKEDVQQAKQNLAAAGFPDGKGMPELRFTYNTNPQWKLMGEYLQQRYKDVLGIDLKLDPMEWAGFLKWRRGEDWQTSGDLYRGGWFADYEDPNNWHNVLWDSREDPGVFSSGWKDEAYDVLVRRARREADPARREQLYAQAEQVLAREYPHIPVFHYGIQALVKPYVENFEPRRILGITPLHRVRLADRP